MILLSFYKIEKLNNPIQLFNLISLKNFEKLFYIYIYMSNATAMCDYYTKKDHKKVLQTCMDRS